MASSPAKTLFGFLSIMDDEQLGSQGGLLILNTSGRPVEFHCTAPVRANRAQEILYGPTLKSFLYGEQIGQALFSKAKVSPEVVFVDVPESLTLRSVAKCAVALVPPGDEEMQLAPAANGFAPSVQRHFWNEQPLDVASEFAGDAQSVLAALDSLVVPLELAEPFERIQGALEEARRSAA